VCLRRNSSSRISRSGWYSDPAKPPEEFYVIGPGDVLNINIWKEPSLSGTVKLRPTICDVALVNENSGRRMTTTN